MEDSRESKVNTTDQVEQSIPRHVLKARLAQTLSRSVVEDRLTIPMPPHLHGEWVLDDEVEIARKTALGFRVNKGEYGNGHSLHNDGTGRIKVGDLIHVYIDKETKNIIDEIAYEKYKENHMGRKQKEEKDLEANLSQPDAKTGPVIIQSKESSIDARALVESLPTK